MNKLNFSISVLRGSLLEVLGDHDLVLCFFFFCFVLKSHIVVLRAYSRLCA